MFYQKEKDLLQPRDLNSIYLITEELYSNFKLITKRDIPYFRLFLHRRNYVVDCIKDRRF